MQYQSECLSVLKSMANIHKPFEKTFMDTMKLFMAIPDRINFLQLGRAAYGELLCCLEAMIESRSRKVSAPWSERNVPELFIFGRFYHLQLCPAESLRPYELFPRANYTYPSPTVLIA